MNHWLLFLLFLLSLLAAMTSSKMPKLYGRIIKIRQSLIIPEKDGTGQRIGANKGFISKQQLTVIESNVLDAVKHLEKINIGSFIEAVQKHLRSLKSGGVDRRTTKPAPSSFGLKSDERAEKTKENEFQFTKKLDKKTIAKEAESRQLQTKSKEEKESDIKKLRQSLNFKAMPMPGFYWGPKASKTPLDKEGSKTLRI